MYTFTCKKRYLNFLHAISDCFHSADIYTSGVQHFT